MLWLFLRRKRRYYIIQYPQNNIFYFSVKNYYSYKMYNTSLYRKHIITPLVKVVMHYAHTNRCAIL